MIEFNGPDFDPFDNRILCLELIRNGLTHAVMFDEQGLWYRQRRSFTNKPA